MQAPFRMTGRHAFMRIMVTAMILILTQVIATLPANAHPRKESETDITFNPQTQTTEIVHRFRIPDAETAVQAAYGGNLDLIGDEKVRIAFGFYIQDHFMLTANGRRIETDLIGAEIADGWLWVYQEAPALPPDGDFILRFNALMETYSQQVNLVNVRLAGEVQSFILYRQSPWVRFRSGDPK